MFKVELWGILVLASVLGAVAALISQFTAAKKGLEAGAKAKTLGKNLQDLVDRNTVRRGNLQERQKILDTYVNMNIEHQKGQLDDKALKDAIDEEKKRVASITEAIRKSETAITETRTKLAEVEQEKALTGWKLGAFSVVIGAATAAIFGFMGYIGQDDKPLSFTKEVVLTSNLFVQSLALGAGWPLVWEKFFGADKLDSIASAAAAKFQYDTKDAETKEV